ncbi:MULTISPECIES: VgrG-related protein [Streptomyces]|uniref:VgrG-related protein n=2 Tax=Streptomyces TaxID=1883 RepID=A0ABU4KF30_9ACTN|nr:VgrG-related protein [Streptomyces roseolus]MDX2296399.1 VgrG-related protein [Streptomyces roseolus]
MMAPGVASALLVEVAGTPLPARLMNTLVEGYVDDSRTLPDLFLLRFRDPDRTLLAQGGIAVGAEIRLLARGGGGTEPVPLLTGVVTALELELDESGTYTVVRGLDETYRLLRGARVAGYQNMTLSDIVAQVAQRAGLKPGTVDVAGPVLDHVAQANVSDWEFVRGLAEEAGAQAYVRDGRLHVVRPAEAGGAPDASARADRDPLVLERGANLLRCRASVSAAEQVSEVEVRGWDVRGKRALVGRAPAGTSPRLALGVTAAQVTAPFGEARHVVTDGGYGTQERVDRAAKALAERIAGSFAELEAVIRGNPEVRAGTAVALNAVGAPFEGRYTVTSSRHVFDAVRGYETWLTVSGQQERSLFGLTGGGGPAEGRRPGGLVNATVTDTQDPDGSGRVKVTFPWLSDEYASDWARTAQAAGTGGGEPYIPEVGDEVVVGFELGRLDRPYVLGGLYNGQDRPTGGGAVDPTSGAVDRRAFASKGGHKLELLDAAGGAQGVRLRTGDGKLTIDLDQAGTEVTIGSDGAVRITAQEKVSITASGGVSVAAERGALELSGDSVSVTARQGVRMDGGQGAVRLATGGALEVRGSTVTVDGTQRTELKGGTTLSVAAPLVKIN